MNANTNNNPDGQGANQPGRLPKDPGTPPKRRRRGGLRAKMQQIPRQPFNRAKNDENLLNTIQAGHSGNTRNHISPPHYTRVRIDPEDIVVVNFDNGRSCEGKVNRIEFHMAMGQMAYFVMIDGKELVTTRKQLALKENFPAGIGQIRLTSTHDPCHDGYYGGCFEYHFESSSDTPESLKGIQVNESVKIIRNDFGENPQMATACAHISSSGTLNDNIATLAGRINYGLYHLKRQRLPAYYITEHDLYWRKKSGKLAFLTTLTAKVKAEFNGVLYKITTHVTEHKSGASDWVVQEAMIGR